MVYNKKDILFGISSNSPNSCMNNYFDNYDEIFSFYNETKTNTSLSTLFKIPKTPYANRKIDCFEQR